MLKNMGRGLFIFNVLLVLLHPITNLSSCFTYIFCRTIVAVYLIYYSSAIRDFSFVFYVTELGFEGGDGFVGNFDRMLLENSLNTF